MLNSIVRINKDIKAGQIVNGCLIKPAMVTYKNRLAEVKTVDIDGSFTLDITPNYIWEKEMVTVVAKKLKTSDQAIYSLKSIVTDLGCIDVTGQSDIDSYIDSALKTAREIINVLEVNK